MVILTDAVSAYRHELYARCSAPTLYAVCNKIIAPSSAARTNDSPHRYFGEALHFYRSIDPAILGSEVYPECMSCMPLLAGSEKHHAAAVALVAWNLVEHPSMRHSSAYRSMLLACHALMLLKQEEVPLISLAIAATLRVSEVASSVDDTPDDWLIGVAALCQAQSVIIGRRLEAYFGLSDSATPLSAPFWIKTAINRSSEDAVVIWRLFAKECSLDISTL